MELIKSWAHHGGAVRRYRHASASTGTPMSFLVFLPPQALGDSAKVPAIYFLAGLECTDETFAMKGGAFAQAAKAGVAFICPDTSPRGAGIPGESDSWDFGVAAGFYVDAAQAPWSANYRMFSYVTVELPELVNAHLDGGEGTLVSDTLVTTHVLATPDSPLIYHGAFHGWTWGADVRPQMPRQVSLRYGVCSHFESERGPSLQRLHLPALPDCAPEPRACCSALGVRRHTLAISARIGRPGVRGIQRIS